MKLRQHDKVVLILSFLGSIIFWGTYIIELFLTQRFQFLSLLYEMNWRRNPNPNFFQVYEDLAKFSHTDSFWRLIIFVMLVHIVFTTVGYFVFRSIFGWVQRGR